MNSDASRVAPENQSPQYVVSPINGLSLTLQGPVSEQRLPFVFHLTVTSAGTGDNYVCIGRMVPGLDLIDAAGRALTRDAPQIVSDNFNWALEGQGKLSQLLPDKGVDSVAELHQFYLHLSPGALRRRGFDSNRSCESKR